MRKLSSLEIIKIYSDRKLFEQHFPRDHKEPKEGCPEITLICRPAIDSIEPGMRCSAWWGNATRGIAVRAVDKERKRVLVVCNYGGSAEYAVWRKIDDIQCCWKVPYVYYG